MSDEHVHRCDSVVIETPEATISGLRCRSCARVWYTTPSGKWTERPIAGSRLCGSGRGEKP